MSEFFVSLLKGMYPYFFIPALFVVIYRIKYKLWTSVETLILLFVFVHAIAEILQVLVGARVLYMSRRYLLPCAPLAFGYLAWGIVHLVLPILKKVNFRHKYRIAVGAASLLAGLLIFDGARSVIKTYYPTKKGHERRFVKKLTPKLKNITSSRLDLSLKFSPGRYIAPYYYRIVSPHTPLALWSGGRHIEKPDKDCHILVLEKGEKVSEPFVLLFAEKIDHKIYHIYVRKEMKSNICLEP